MKKELLIPKETYNDLTSVDFATLANNGIEHIWLDIDNTVALWGDNNVSDGVISWVRKAVSLGYRVCLVTNGHKDRVDDIAGKLGVDFKKSAGKPYTSKLKAFARQLNISDMSRVVIIGDQLFTDILLANKLGAYSILVKPLSDNEWWATKLFNRTRERFVRKYIFK